MGSVYPLAAQKSGYACQCVRVCVCDACKCVCLCVCASVADRICVCIICAGQPEVVTGNTEELEFKGEHVLHMIASEMKLCQREYSIQDTFNTDKVLVPSTSACLCRLFRVQHKQRGRPDPRVGANRRGNVCVGVFAQAWSRLGNHVRLL